MMSLGSPPAKGEDWSPPGEGQSLCTTKMMEELIKDLTGCTLMGLWASLSLSFPIGGKNTYPTHLAIWRFSGIKDQKMLYKL